MSVTIDSFEAGPAVGGGVTASCSAKRCSATRARASSDTRMMYLALFRTVKSRCACAAAAREASFRV